MCLNLLELNLNTRNFRSSAIFCGLVCGTLKVDLLVCNSSNHDVSVSFGQRQGFLGTCSMKKCVLLKVTNLQSKVFLHLKCQ